MRPLSLEFQAFGPYAGHEFIDFDALSSKGLFLICGETGSGKTMLLDALSFALYGKSTGSTRDDIESLRCNRCNPDDETFVTLIVESSGETFKFERRLTKKVKNFHETQNVYKKDEEGVFQPLFENCKKKNVEEKAKEITGLDFEQFNQVIVLPQGKFEKLLTSDSDEKEKILVTIFGAGKWKKIADAFYANAEDAKRKMDMLTQDIRFQLENAECASIADIKTKAESIDAELKEKTEEYENKNYDKRLKEIDEYKLISREFENFEKQTARRDSLLSKKEDIALRGIALERALKAEKTADYFTAVNEAVKERIKREGNLSEAEAGEKLKKDKLSEAEELLKKHGEKEKAYSDAKEKLSLMNKIIDVYKNLDIIEKEFALSKVKFEDSLNKEKKASDVLETRTKETADKLAKYEAASKDVSLKFESYLKGISGDLAEHLVENEACPVCGSKTHPNPAMKAKGAVEKKDVDKADELSRACKAAWDEADEKRRAAEENLKQAAQNRQTAEIAKTEAEGKVKSARENLLEGITTYSELEKAIAEAEKYISDYEKNKIKLEDAHKEAMNSFTQAKTLHETAKEELQKAKEKENSAKEELEIKVKENGFENIEDAQKAGKSQSEREEISRSIAEYNASLKECEASLEDAKKHTEGKEKPDILSLTDEQKMITDIQKQFYAYSEEKKKKINELNRLYDEISKKALKYEEKRARVDEDLSFAKNLRGDTGVGLQRYVLGVMFSSVIAEANRMLENVHGGRYRLVSTADKVKGTNKRGLDLKVYDSYSTEEEGRLVSTLSGGEKFLASLALSIGMSAVAKSGGVAIEAMFIDEGFGSLDESSIEDAMNVLNSIRKANGMVGIISHVSVLADNIPTKVIVSKKRESSHVNVSIG